MENVIAVLFILLVALIIAVSVMGMLLSKRKQEIEQEKFQTQAKLSAMNASCENKINELIKKHEEALALVNQQHAEKEEILCRDYEKKLRENQEHIESRKEVLLAKNEKELLTEVMVALDGYASRLARIETSLIDTKIIDHVSKLVDEVSSKIHGVEDQLVKRISDMNDSLENAFDDYYLRQKMDELDMEISSLRDDMTSIGSKIDDIHSGMDDVHSISSMSYEMESIKDAVEESKQAAENAQYAAESARDAIESLG